MTDGPDNGTGVRVSNRQIYDLVLNTRERVLSLENLMQNKVLSDHSDIRKRMASVEVRVYGIMAGIVAAAVGAKNLGVF